MIIKDCASAILAVVGATLAFGAIVNGQTDPVYILGALLLLTIVLIGHSIRRWQKIAIDRADTPSRLEIPDELRLARERDRQQRMRMERQFVALPIAFLVVTLAVLSMTASSYILRPADVKFFETIGGFEAYDADDASPYWYFPCERLSLDTAASSHQNTLQHIYRYGHGAAFELIKRPTVAHAVVREIRVRVASLKPAPAVHVPFHGAIVRLPYVLIADIPEGAKVGTVVVATFYRRDEATGMLMPTVAALELEDFPELFEVRINSQTEGLLTFAVEISFAAGARSTTINAGETLECLYLTHESIAIAQAVAEPRELERVKDWLDSNSWNGREFVQRKAKSHRFGPDSWSDEGP